MRITKLEEKQAEARILKERINNETIDITNNDDIILLIEHGYYETVWLGSTAYKYAVLN